MSLARNSFGDFWQGSSWKDGWDGWILSQQLTSQSFAVIAGNLCRTQYGGSLLRLALLCMKLRATQITSNVIRYRGYVLDAGAGHVYLFWRGVVVTKFISIPT